MKEKTIDKYLLACNENLYTFLEIHKYSNVSEEMRSILKNGFERICSYYQATKDKKLYTTYEFLAIIDCLGRIENYDISDAEVFIDVIKKLENTIPLTELNIANDKLILFTLSKNFNREYFESINGKRYLEKELYDAWLWKASKEKHIWQLNDDLKKKNNELKSKKDYALQELKNHIKLYTYYPYYKSLENMLLKILIEINYDYNKLFDNMPDVGLVAKDFEASKDLSIDPISYTLLLEYLTNRKGLNKYQDNLGFYMKDDKKEEIPFTKSEFIAGIHSELQPQKRFRKY